MLREMSLMTLPRSVLARYGLAILLSFGMIHASLYLQPHITRTQFLLVFVAVVASAAYGGLGPGLLAALLGAAGLHLYVFGSIGILGLPNADILAGTAAFLIVSLLISALAERRYQLQRAVLLILDALPAGVAFLDSKLRYRFVNESFESGFDVLRHKLFGKRSDHFPGDPLGDVQSYLEGALKGEPAHFEMDMDVGKAGPRQLAVSFVPAIQRNGKVAGVCALLNDVTERRLIERDLEHNRRLFQRMAEASPDIIAVYDLRSQTIRYVNNRVNDILGRTPEDFIKEGPDFLMRITHPEDQADFEHFRQRISKMADGEVALTHLRVHHANGGYRWFCLRVIVFSRLADGSVKEVLHVGQDRTEERLAQQEATRSQKELADLNARLEAEIGERVAELRKKEEELYQVRKLEAIGQLAGGVAHDFNNLITGIMGMSESLRDSLETGDPRRQDAEDIVQASRRTSALTAQLLAFARRQIVKPQIVDVNAAVQEVSVMLRRLITEDLRLDLKLGRPAHIQVDPSQFQQILINLVVNARDAMPQPGVITIRTAAGQVPPRQTDVAEGQQAPLGYALIEIQDTGVGMDAETQSHLFEPFFTTKEKYKGTGLGLATVYGIVKQSGGEIDVRSTPGNGSTFRVFLPQIAAPQVKSPDPSKIAAEHHADTVLLVEDEPIVRKVMGRRLRQAGYSVIEAANGSEAIAVAEKFPSHIDVVVSDVVMPEMNGPEVVAQIQERRPRVAVLYVSGYPEDVIAKRGVLKPGIEFIEKPLVTALLANKVREVLQKSRH